MPLVPTNMSATMNGKGASLKITGTKFSSFSSAISKSASTYILSSAIVNSTNIVLGPGAGTYTGQLTGIVPTIMANLMRLKASSLGLSGRDLGKLFNAVATGVVSALPSVLAQGSVIGGGPGTGTGRVTALVPTVLTTQIIAIMSAHGIVGKNIKDIASAMATGICNHIMQNGTVITTCIGAAAPPPTGPVTIPGAPGPGKLI